MDTAIGRIHAIGQIFARSPVLTVTPEQMAQRIAPAGNAAGGENQAELAKAGKARVMPTYAPSSGP